MESTRDVDPYMGCERGRCNHDLARAVTIEDLWDDDGPFAGGPLTLRHGSATAVLFDDEERPYEPDVVTEQQRWAI